MKVESTAMVLAVLLVVVSTPLLLLYLLIFFAMGGGWAYAGPNGCHFKLNMIGWLMILLPAGALSALSWKFLNQPDHKRS